MVQETCNKSAANVTNTASFPHTNLFNSGILLSPIDNNFTGQLLLIQSRGAIGCNCLTNQHSKDNRLKVIEINNFNDLC